MMSKGLAIAAGAVLVLGLAATPMVVEKIEPGHVGVHYKPSSGVQKEVFQPGWEVVAPFDKVIEYPTRTQTKSIKDLVLSTKDGKNVTVDFSYSFSVNPEKVVDLFNKYGAVSVDDIATKGYLRQQLFDAARDQVSKVTVLELFGEQSSQVSADIQNQFAEKVLELGFIVEDLSLGAPKPDEKTQEAIDARVKASQELDRKKTELEIAKAESERILVESEAKAKKTVIEAEAEAKANKLLSNSITSELIKLKEAEARAKHGWVEIQGVAPTLTQEVEKKN